MEKEKQQKPPISMEVYRQLIFDIAMDMTDGGSKDHPNIVFAQRLIDLADRPVI